MLDSDSDFYCIQHDYVYVAYILVSCHSLCYYKSSLPVLQMGAQTYSRELGLAAKPVIKSVVYLKHFGELKLLSIPKGKKKREEMFPLGCLGLFGHNRVKWAAVFFASDLTVGAQIAF